MNVAPDAPATTIDVIAYDKDRIVEKSHVTAKQLDEFMHQVARGVGERHRPGQCRHAQWTSRRRSTSIRWRWKTSSTSTNGPRSTNTTTTSYCVVRMPDTSRDELHRRS